MFNINDYNKFVKLDNFIFLNNKFIYWEYKKD